MDTQAATTDPSTGAASAASNAATSTVSTAAGSTAAELTVSTAAAAAAPASTSVLRPLRGNATVQPRNQTQRAKVLAALSRIASVSVTGPINNDGHTIYVITSHFASILHPTFLKETVGHSAPNAGTQIQATHSFREFTNLRREMFFHAHSGHLGDVKNTCEFCIKVVAFLSSSTTLPRLWKRFLSNPETLRQQFESFLNVVLQLATKATVHPTRWCEGEEMVPLLVKKFLLGDAGEEDLSGLALRPNTSNPNDVFAGWGF